MRVSVAVQLSKAKSLNFPWLNFLEAALEVLQLFVGHLLIHDNDGVGDVGDAVLVVGHLFHPEHESQGLKVHPASVPLIKVVLKKNSAVLKTCTAQLRKGTVEKKNEKITHTESSREELAQ